MNRKMGPGRGLSIRTHAAVVVRKPEGVGNSLTSGVGHVSDVSFKIYKSATQAQLGHLLLCFPFSFPPLPLAAMPASGGGDSTTLR